MMTVTTAAHNRIKEVLNKKVPPGQLYLRIQVNGGGCSGFMYDIRWDSQINQGDQVVDDLVIVDIASQPFILGATLDYQVTMMGENFKVINPNAQSGCGCGESFSI